MDGTILAWAVFAAVSLAIILTASWLKWTSYNRNLERQRRRMRQRIADEMEDGDDEW